MAPIHSNQTLRIIDRESETDDDSEAETDDDSGAETDDSDAPTDPGTRRIYMRYRRQNQRYAREEEADRARIEALNAAYARSNGIQPGFLLRYPTNQRAIRVDANPLPRDLLPDPEEIYRFEIPDDQAVMGFQTPPRAFRVVQPPWAPPRPSNPRHLINANTDDADDDDDEDLPAQPRLLRLDAQDGSSRPRGGSGPGFSC